MKKIFLIWWWIDSSNYSDYETYLKNEEYNPYEEKIFGWKDHLKESFKNDFDIIQIPMPNKFFANYNYWKIMFEKALPYFWEENILIGHSLWWSFLLKYLNENALKNISQIHLIAPAVFDSEEEKLWSFEFKKSLENFKTIENVFIYFSYDDFVVSFKDWEYLQNVLNKANFITYTDKEHFIFVSEIKELEENIKNII